VHGAHGPGGEAVKRLSAAVLAAALAAALTAPVRAEGEGDEDAADPSMQSTSLLTVFYDSTGPMAFVAMTPKDVPAGARLIREVRGVSCQRGLSLPTALSLTSTSVGGAYGDGGYARALADIRKKHPEAAGIYDVRVDLETFSLFGFYQTLCTIVTARGFEAPPAPAAK